MWASGSEVKHLREDVSRLLARISDLERDIRQVAGAAGLVWRSPEGGRFERPVLTGDLKGDPSLGGGLDSSLHRCQDCGWLHRGSKPEGK